MKRTTLMAMLLFLLFAACTRNEAYLRYELTEGRTYLLRMQNEQIIQQTVLNNNISMNTVMDLTMKYRVKGVTDSIYELEVSYDKMKMEMELPNGSVTYDSETEDSTNVLSSVMKNLTGMNFTVNMRKTGKIESIKGLTELVSNLTSAIPGDHKTYEDQMGQMMKNYIGEDAVTRNLSMGVPVFPEEAIREGDSWELKTNVKSFLSGDLSTTYELAQLGMSDAVITGDAYFDVKTDSVDLMMTGVELNYDIEGPVKSRYVLNLDNGWIEEGTIDQELSGTVNMPESELMPEGMNIKMNITSKISLQGTVK